MSGNAIDAHYLAGNSQDHADLFIAISQNPAEATLLATQEDDAIVGVVASAAFDKSSIKPLIEEISAFNKIKVFRHEFPSLDDRWENGLSLIQKGNFSAEITIKPEQFAKLERLAENKPDFEFILAVDYVDRKNKDLKALSKLPNIGLKILISNLEYESARAWVLDTIDLFKSMNVMFGMGDQRDFNVIEKVVADFSDSDKENLFRNSVSKWYKLNA